MGTVIVTGGNRGLGLQICLAFGRAGYEVYAGVRDSQKAIELAEISARENLHIKTKHLDITEPQTFPSFIDEILAASGSIDVLVNNAGIIRPGACEDLTEQDIRKVMETNFLGALLLTRTVLPTMRDQCHGKIIMVSSLSGIAGLAGDVIYSASKFALEGATEALRHEVSRWGIHVALVEAGLYATGLFDQSFGPSNLLPPDYPTNSAYLPLIKARQHDIHKSMAHARTGQAIGNMMVEIAHADGSQLRWQTDDFATEVASTLFGLSDSERDNYLRSAAKIDWWINGKDSPE